MCETEIKDRYNNEGKHQKVLHKFHVIPNPRHSLAELFTYLAQYTQLCAQIFVPANVHGTELIINPQTPDGVYKPTLVYCRMGLINTSPFPTLHLSRNAAKVSESLKISDQRMAKRC